MASATETATDGKENKPKRARLELMKDWQVSEDGRSVTRTFPIESFKEASKLASRIVAFSCKHSIAIDLHADGQTIVVGMPQTTAPTQLLDRKQRAMAQRLERLVAKPEKIAEASE